MSRALTIVALLLASALAACGAPKEGDSCSQSGFLCTTDNSSALECKVGKWVALPCRGPNACSRESDIVRCDMSGNLAGDNCASTSENKGLCTSDGKATLLCREGVLVKTNDCKTCSVSGDQVICQP